jgi:short-subunit dehydrogenase
MGGAFKGQRALITGASSGIGRALARELAARGADVVLVARREDRLRDLADELRTKHGVTAAVLACDLSDPQAPEQLFARTEGAGLAIDLLVNNAGQSPYQPFVEVPWETLARVIQVNMTSLTHLTRLFLPAMLARRRGHVLNVASIGAYSPTPNFAVYAPGKAYVRDFTETINFELRGTGVRATCLCPGGVATEFLDQAGQEVKPGGERWIMSAEKCARITVDKMLAGRITIIPGFLNALGMWLLRFVPRRFMPGIADRSMQMAVERRKN